MKRKILFLVPYPTEGASARLRVEQFLPFLEKEGMEYSLRPFLTPSFYRILYRRGRTVKKMLLFLFCVFRRILDILKAPFYDIIFIHREAFPVGPPLFEALLFIMGKTVIFDFDDAIYLPSEGSSRIVTFLKCPWKTDFIIRKSDAVIAGNEFLKYHALAYNTAVVVIPTCIDTDYYKRSDPKRTGGGITVGWIGSHTTQIFLKELEGVFGELLAKYSDLEISLIGAQPGLFDHPRIAIKEWSLAGEKDELAQFDIGIMPMPDTDWTRGKCAFKAILNMSLEIPVVASPVGVNTQLIKDGVNGYLAADGVAWKERLTLLIEDRPARERIGIAGRKTVEERFSLTANAPLFLGALKGSRRTAR